MTDCLAHVAARAAGTSVEAFKVFALMQRTPEKATFSVRMFYAFLLHHGLVAGFRLTEPQLCGHIIAVGPFDIRTTDALVVVETSRRGWGHALYWCASSGKLIDCKAEGHQEVSVEDYRISEWVPIAKLLT